MLEWREKLSNVVSGRSPAGAIYNALVACLGMKLRTVVEVGVYEGANARRLREYLKPEKLYLVDPWAVTKATGKYNVKYLGDGLWDALYQRICAEFSGPDCEILRLKSAQAALHFKDNSLDFVYLDGDHRLEFIREDIRLWYPKVRPGGVLGGHDFSAPRRFPNQNRVRDAVIERFGMDNVWVGKHRVWLHVKEGGNV